MTLIIIIIIVIVNLLTVDKKKGFTQFREKSRFKSTTEGGKIIYLYKSVNINFFIKFKIISKLQEISCRKLIRTYLVNTCFA